MAFYSRAPLTTGTAGIDLGQTECWTQWFLSAGYSATAGVSAAPPMATMGGTMLAPVAASTANTTGFYLSSRTSTASGAFSLYRNGALLQSGTSTEVNMPDRASVHLSGVNVINGYGCTGGMKFFSDREAAFASLGAGMTATEAATFTSIVQAYQAALGRAP